MVTLTEGRRSDASFPGWMLGRTVPTLASGQLAMFFFSRYDTFYDRTPNFCATYCVPKCTNRVISAGFRNQLISKMYESHHISWFPEPTDIRNQLSYTHTRPVTRFGFRNQLGCTIYGPFFFVHFFAKNWGSYRRKCRGLCASTPGSR